MDARAWTGSDDRPELAPDPIERCPWCGSDVDDDCDPNCCCDSCMALRDDEPVPNYDAPSKAERDSVERDEMAYIQRELK